MKSSMTKSNMLRRFAAAAACCAVMASFGGCSSIFEREYVSVNDHVDEYIEPEQISQTVEVKNYAAMRNAVLGMVEGGVDHFMFTTENYSGNAKEDISRACLEVTRETPIGAFAVEYMTHYCTQILTYFRIEVFVTYKHTPEEIASVKRVSGFRELIESIITDVVDYKNRAVYSFVGIDVNESVIRDAITDEYRNSPVMITDLPAVSCSTYPNEESVQKIIEIKYEYSEPAGTLSLRRSAILSSAGALLYDNPAEGSLLDVFNALRKKCSFDPAGGRSAYDAVVLGVANSEGVAMGFKLMCDLTGAECYVVDGRRDGEPYFWNIVKIGDEYYHSDVAECLQSGPEEYFMLRDSDMWGRYLWDTVKYVPCEGELLFEDVFERLDAEPPPLEEDQP